MHPIIRQLLLNPIIARSGGMGVFLLPALLLLVSFAMAPIGREFRVGNGNIPNHGRVWVTAEVVEPVGDFALRLRRNTPRGDDYLTVRTDNMNYRGWGDVLLFRDGSGTTMVQFRPIAAPPQPLGPFLDVYTQDGSIYLNCGGNLYSAQKLKGESQERVYQSKRSGLVCWGDAQRGVLSIREIQENKI